ncbi:family 20 glycosylhydrolase [Spelaeicoccus albus]|uniref:Hexosaminidase n=1 Tax=Spelaeicoccus albus TaxID=1280376 RepID=A0A7Z0ABC1_9MICO|nr:family 20 glycosylhydrolase [Spelaeicoccus albus]NYI66725.1 hexosaminidase [Spelaeicoccus albus]
MSSATVPAVQVRRPATGVVTDFKRIVLSRRDAPELRGLAVMVQAELAPDTVPVVVDAARERGDLCLELAYSEEPVGNDVENGNEEGYRIATDEAVVVSARHPAGVYYATRTVLQLVRTGGVDADIVDWPVYPQRGVMLDIGRKYFTPGWIKKFIRELGWLKLNTLHLHLNDNSGVGLECRAHPEIVSTPALSREDLASILDTAAAHHVTVIPEFDSPAHARAITRAHPEFALRDRHGRMHFDKLDFSLPAARRLVERVITEWADLFDGRWFDIGGDEFFAAPWEDESLRDPGLFPCLAAYASDRRGRPLSAHDGYTIYMNDLADLVHSRGKRAKMWNDHVDPRTGSIAIAGSVQIDCWIRWNASFPSAAELAQAGYSLVNRNGDYLYFILSADEPPGHDIRKSPEGIYRNWHVRRFMGTAGGSDQDLDRSASVDGAVLSIWCDSPATMTEQEVAENVLGWLQSFSQRVWDSPSPANYSTFTLDCRRIGAKSDRASINRLEPS